MQPEISVIVPMYKTEKTVARCLDSLISQTCRALEIIVVDDGSPDDGYKVVEEYAQRDSRLRLFRTENKGLGAARNYGIKQARAEYVAFVDSDDYVAAGMYEKMLRAMRQTGTGLCVCGEKNVYIDKNGDTQELAGTEYPGEGVAVFSQKQVLDWYLNSAYLALNSACFKLVDKKVFTEQGVWFPEEYRFAEDLVASAGMYCYFPEISIVCEGLYYYVHELGTISTDYSLKKAYDVLEDHGEVCSYLKETAYEGTRDNFALSMQFSSLKQIYWMKNGADKKSEKARELKKTWKHKKKEGKWRPGFRNVSVPPEHKLKIIVSYLGWTRLACFLIARLRWIPFFKYMT